jgi:hypothetical protein
MTLKEARAFVTHISSSWEGLPGSTPAITSRSSLAQIQTPYLRTAAFGSRSTALRLLYRPTGIPGRCGNTQMERLIPKINLQGIETQFNTEAIWTEQVGFPAQGVQQTYRVESLEGKARMLDAEAAASA